MRIIDKTSSQDERGNISLIARIQGTLKYGLSWYSELEAQKSVIPLLDRLLEKHFVLIRNFNLPESDIIIPIILIGSGSLTVMLTTPVKGQFEAKGSEWNTVSNGTSTPAPKNLINILSKLSRVFQRYLEINKINIPMPVEAVLLSTNPGANIDSVRPEVRVVRSDAVKQFASLLNQAKPLLRADQINAIADLILEPKPKTTVAPPEPQMPAARPMSRAQTIFKASETSAPQAVPTSAQSAAPQPKPVLQPVKKKKPALTGRQMLLLAVLGIFACCIIIAAAYTVFTVLST